MSILGLSKDNYVLHHFLPFTECKNSTKIFHILFYYFSFVFLWWKEIVTKRKPIINTCCNKKELWIYYLSSNKPALYQIDGEGNGSPLQFLPGKSHGWRSLVGCNPWGHEESDTTEWLSDFTFHSHALGKEIATHSSVLAWRIPWMEEPGGLPSMGSQ